MKKRAVFQGQLEVLPAPTAGKRPKTEDSDGVAQDSPAEPPQSSQAAPDLRGEFCGWLQQNKFQISDKLDIWSSKGVSGRGVLAISDIDEGETLVAIPLYISMDHPCLAAVKAAASELSLTLQLAMAVLHLQHTEGHAFGPYISAMPSGITNALQLTDDHRTALQGTCIEHELNVSIMEERHASLVLPILKQHRALWPKASHSFEAFKHAIFLLMSRGFFSADIGGPYLIPVADLFNHSNTRRCTHLELLDGAFVLRAERPIKEGEEVFNTYGPVGNARLFHTYGFIEDDNPFDEVHLKRDIVVETCEVWCKEQGQSPALLKRKRAVLEACGLLLEVFVLCKADMIPDVLLTVLQAYAMEEEEFEAFETNPSLLGADFDADDDTFVASVYSLMLKVLDRKLASYAEPHLTLQQEKEATLLAQKEGDHIRYCILSIRHQERRMLLELKAQLVEELKEMHESDEEAENNKLISRDADEDESDG